MGTGPRRIGILGGTFDPPHHGHLVAAVGAGHQLDLDLVLLVVANQPWQKAGGRMLTDAADRLDMVREMVAGVGRVEASDLEIRRGGLTYSADTVGELRGRWPNTELWLIVGADVASAIESWKRLDEVRAGAGLAVVARGQERVDLAALRAAGWRAAPVAIPRLDVSSSDLRRRMRAGEPVEGLVAPAVIRIARERRLYADGE